METPAMATPLRVLVVDDEPTALRRLARLLSEIPGVEVVRSCASGRDALLAVAAHRPDVVFLDVEMPGLNGLEVARRLRDGGPPVVFVTAYDAHAIEAFRLHAADYVVKPLDPARLRDAVEHVRRMIPVREAASRGPTSEPASAPATAPRVVIRDGRREHYVRVADILWIESYGNYARVYATGGRYLHRATMQRIQAQLAPYGFARVHRTAIVNVARVVRLQPVGSGQHEAVLDTGVRLRVSRTYRTELEAREARPALG
jgi:two-component system LytT family response regulator